MSGETNLAKLLATMEPKLLDDEYVFCALPDAKYGDYAEFSPLASFLEAEGLTLLMTKENAEKANFKYEAVFKGISLTIHSSLEAVG
jgi:hypothetical protein